MVWFSSFPPDIWNWSRVSNLPLIPELPLFTSSAMANRLKFFFLISPCMLQINDTLVQIQAVMTSQYPRS